MLPALCEQRAPFPCRGKRRQTKEEEEEEEEEQEEEREEQEEKNQSKREEAEERTHNNEKTRINGPCACVRACVPLLFSHFDIS
jgi:hypothetical protein